MCDCVNICRVVSTQNSLSHKCNRGKTYLIKQSFSIHGLTHPFCVVHSYTPKKTFHKLTFICRKISERGLLVLDLRLGFGAEKL